LPSQSTLKTCSVASYHNSPTTVQLHCTSPPVYKTQIQSNPTKRKSV
jgi:hypothetical protein